MGEHVEIGDTVVERVKRQGMYQRITFTVIVETTAFGKVKLLRSKKTVDLAEALRLANKYDLPVHAGEMHIVVPEGKMLKDFTIS